MKRIPIICFLLLCLQSGYGQLTYETLMLELDSAIEYKNLRLVPIKQKQPGQPITPDYISLAKAIESGLVTISERGTTSVENVHWLRINNRSRKPLLISSGELIMGGRQDRMVTHDTVLAATGTDQYIQVMCVEEDRWSEKEKKFNYFNYANPRLRRILDQTHNQVKLWKEIYQQLDSTGVRSPTLSYMATRTDKKFIADQEGYLNYYISRIKKTDSSWVGFVCMSGDRVIGTEIFEGIPLLYEQLLPLLNGYIEEAITTGSIVTIKEEKLLRHLDHFMKNEEEQERWLKKNGKLFRYQGRVIHLTDYGE